MTLPLLNLYLTHPSPHTRPRPSNIPPRALPLNRARLCRLPLSKPLIPTRPFPSPMQPPRRKLAHPPHTRRHDCCAHRRRRRQPCKRRDHPRRCCPNRCNDGCDRNVFRVAYDAPEDEDADVADCAEEGARSEAGGVVGCGGGVEEEVEVAFGGHEG
jgi:hypothetical protein